MLRSAEPPSLTRGPLRTAALAFCTLVLGLAACRGGMWDPLPMTVHEWGVNTFDWDSDKRLLQELPDFLYTDKKNGKLVSKPAKRVRDLPPDSGIRTKPILYFYPNWKHRMERPPQVGVETRFAYGHAIAWWPQVNLYRTGEMSRAAKAPDWETWKSELLKKYEALIKANNKDGKAAERWAQQLAIYGKLDEAEQIAWLANRFRWFGESDFPEDGRMQLVWERLTLHEKVPEGQSLPGAELPDDHWVKVAREVDAAYVSNGREAERYVFYEGKTREQPAIAVLPPSGPQWSFRGEGQNREVAVVNVGEHPIFDVIAVYRDSAKGILWTDHVPMLPALPPTRHLVDQVMALRVPDFARPGPGDEIKLGDEEFTRRTKDLLLRNLTAGHHYDPGMVTMRDPADPQPPTRMHQLFRKEAVSLEKIWHDDFFEQEGLTVIYRESPAYLDEAMPLNIFTSMFWYVKLSRCGLVLNRNVPIEGVREVDLALQRFANSKHNKAAPAEVEKWVAQLKEDPFLARGLARYRYARRAPAGWGHDQSGLIEEIEALLSD